LVLRLLTLGAPVDAPDLQGDTALICSARRSDKAAVDALLAAKANVEVTNKDGKSALEVAKGAKVWALLQDHIDRKAVESKLARSCSLPSLKPSPAKHSGSMAGASSPVRRLSKTSAADAAGASNGFRVRVDGLPTRFPAEQLEAHVSKIVRRRRVDCPSFVDVAVDPITLKPKGHCFLGFDSKEKAAAAVDCLDGALDACVECN